MDVESYQREISNWTSSLLDPYLARIVEIEQGSGAVKEFNDPLWGTVSLRPEEVVVLDSPLLQRLRRIKQLGVVHFVYTSANHTRFDHSIGVCHQVGRIASSISTHLVDGMGASAISDAEISLLRMAGLCHDIGHGALSHVIENALRNDRETRSLLKGFSELHSLDSPPHLSEVAAHFMMLSETFHSLLKEAFRIAGLQMPKKMNEHMAAIVIGVKVSDEFPLLHELISGPFDADKLDYMPRDAMMTGVPVVTDIGRLIQKVRAVRMPSDQLPTALKAVVEGVPSGHLVVGLAQSGGSTLDEVAIGRSLMFDKVYRHHKVRAAEAMVAAVVDALGGRLSDSQPLLPLRVADEDILYLDANRLASISGVPAESLPTDEPGLAVGLDVARRLRNREIFVRSFAFSQHLPDDPYRGDENHRRALDSLLRGASKADTRQILVGKIAEIVRTILSSVNSIKLSAVVRDNIERYIWVDPPSSGHPDAKPDPSRAYIIGADNKPREVRHVNAEQRGWVDAYTNTHDMGYVFTVPELAVLVAIATRIAVFALHELRVPDSWSLHTKLKALDLRTLEDALQSTGFYEASVPPSLRPQSQLMRVAGTPQRLDAASRRLARVQSPTSSTTELKPGAMNAERVRDWVRQFGVDYEESALKLVEATIVLGRVETNTALENFLNSSGGSRFHGASVVPIGQAKDGATVVGYHAADVAESHGCRVADLGQALSEDSPIVFVDDFIGRGSSTISIFEAMFGLEATQNLNERRPGPLNDAIQEHLRNRELAFVYTAGLNGGAEALRARMLQLGLSDKLLIHVDMPEDRLPSLNSTLSGAERETFTKRAAAVGRQLLPDGPREKMSERALGYGNHGLLVAFPYNTPTATLTALWERGKVDNWPWVPLLPRRKKL